MVALHAWRELLCKGCNGWLPETTSPDAEGRYTVDQPVRCYRCAAFATGADRAREMSQPESLLLQVSRRE